MAPAGKRVFSVPWRSLHHVFKDSSLCSASNIGERTKEGFQDGADNLRDGWRNTKRSARESMDDTSDAARRNWEDAKGNARRAGEDVDDAARRCVFPTLSLS